MITRRMAIAGFPFCRWILDPLYNDTFPTGQVSSSHVLPAPNPRRSARVGTGPCCVSNSPSGRYRELDEAQVVRLPTHIGKPGTRPSASDCDAERCVARQRHTAAGRMVVGPSLCRVFNEAIRDRHAPRHLSTDPDRVFEDERWTANLRGLEIDDINPMPHVRPSHPVVERLVDTRRREGLDRQLAFTVPRVPVQPFPAASAVVQDHTHPVAVEQAGLVLRRGHAPKSCLPCVQ